MTDTVYVLVALLLAALPAGALLSGRALGVWWWRSRVSRAGEPAAYWFVVAAQCAILVLFLFTARLWHLR